MHGVDARSHATRPGASRTGCGCAGAARRGRPIGVEDGVARAFAGGRVERRPVDDVDRHGAGEFERAVMRFGRQGDDQVETVVLEILEGLRAGGATVSMPISSITASTKGSCSPGPHAGRVRRRSSGRTRRLASASAIGERTAFSEQANRIDCGRAARRPSRSAGGPRRASSLPVQRGHQREEAAQRVGSRPRSCRAAARPAAPRPRCAARAGPCRSPRSGSAWRCGSAA